VHSSCASGQAIGFKQQRQAALPKTFVKEPKRDRRLSMPKLIPHSLQVNIRGGRLPEPENNGRRYLKIPLDALDAPWDG